MAEGRDISNWQGAPSPAWFAQYDFVIVQAFNEHGGGNPFFAQSMANGAGRCRFGLGVYGWAIAGANNFALGQQLGNIANQYGAALGCWDDHESGGRSWMPSPGAVEQYIAGFESVGQKGGYYSNGSDYISTPFLNGRPWWYANPSGNRNPRPPLIVQYGTPGGVDANRADDAALAAFVGGTGGGGAAPSQSNPGVHGMLLRDPHSGAIYLIGPGHGHHVTSQDDVNQLKFIGIPYDENVEPLVIIAWAIKFGAWDTTTNNFRV